MNRRTVILLVWLLVLDRSMGVISERRNLIQVVNIGETENSYGRLSAKENNFSVEINQPVKTMVDVISINSNGVPVKKSCMTPGHSCMHEPIGYNRKQLIEIGRKVKRSAGKKLTPEVCLRITTLGLNKRRRGHKGGKNKLDVNKGVHCELLRSLAKVTLPKGLLTDMKCGLLNVRSIRRRAETVYAEMIENNLDVLCVTETWVNSDDHDVSVQCSIVNTDEFKIETSNRKKRGGGVGIIFRCETVAVKKMTEAVKTTFQYGIWCCKKAKCTYNIMIIYHPPAGNNGNNAMFLGELMEELE